MTRYGFDHVRERALVVAWLRVPYPFGVGAKYDIADGTLRRLADAIERGDHVPEDERGEGER